jgi:hypothetical protein
MQLYLSRTLQDHAALNRAALNRSLVAEQRARRSIGWLDHRRPSPNLPEPTHPAVGSQRFVAPGDLAVARDEAVPAMVCGFSALFVFH